MKRILLHKDKVLAILTVVALALAWHPMYLSVCQIDHNPETQSLEISLKVFSDDLEDALEARGVQHLHLGSESEHPSADHLLAGYLQQKLQLRMDGQPLELQYLGKEVKLDVTWCYLEVLDVPEVSEMTVSDVLFFELFDAQTNLLHIRAGGKEKSLMLTKSNPTGSVEF